MNETFEKIRKELDWVHDVDGYCVKYIVRHWKESWSRSEYYMVDGILASGGVVDLGSFPTYQSDTKWLGSCIGEHVA